MIYFDCAAAAPVLPEIADAYPDYLKKYSGNPEAAHACGLQLRRQYADLEKQLTRAIFPGRHIERSALFTASDASLLLDAAGAAAAGQGCRTAWGADLEHPADMQMLKRHFSDVKKFTLDPTGIISELPQGSANFIVLSHVQSEIGVRQDLKSLISLLHRRAPEAIILVDAVQSAAWESYPDDAPLPDLLLISGAKLGSGGGSALIACGRHTGKIQTFFKQLRSEHLIGKADLITLAAMTDALKIHRQNRSGETDQIRRVNRFLREKLQDHLMPNGKKLILTVPAECAADNILHLILPGYQSGVLVRMFSAEQIMLSAGSACQAETDEPSLILQGIGYSKKDAFSGLRLSFSPANTLDEAEKFLSVLENILQNY